MVVLAPSLYALSGMRLIFRNKFWPKQQYLVPGRLHLVQQSMPNMSVKAMKNVSKLLAGSVLGHVVLMEIMFSLPFCVYGLISNYLAGSLTFAFALRMFASLVALGALSAAIIWYSSTLPAIKRTKKRGGRGRH